MSLPESFVLIDLETTGANPAHDRITEIAMLRIEHGEIVDRWEHLVNPGCSIPRLIQDLIGITNDMVRDAPPFAALADEVRRRLAGAVFVAHNARFDYGFIRNEFARIGEDFDAPVLCTVKLSRALYPEFHRHGLDALIERHGFNCGARHRAMGDAEVLWQFVRKIEAEFPADVLARARDKAMKHPARPPGLPDGVLEGLPDAPGLYLFYGENDLPLFIGRAASLRARVMEHFSEHNRNRKEAELAAKVRRVEWQETAGELGAQLLEMRLLRSRKPLHNRMAAGDGAVFGLRYLGERKRTPVLRREPIGGTDPATWEALYGAFRSPKEAEAMLREFALLYGLCPRRLGLEGGGSGACAAHKARRCHGVCAGREQPAAHDARLLAALAGAGVKPWPWPGAIAVEEHSEHLGRSVIHVFDRWCHLATLEGEAELAALARALPPRAFDGDAYRIIQRWFSVAAHRAAVRPL
ncbi:MAG: exonuclease domain-containing protein [Rhodocyclaceae bacterium]